MVEQWLSIPEAAASMRVHPRTVERRVAAGKIDSRRNDQGQLEVLVELPDPVDPVPSEAFETVKELADRQVDIAAGSASALIRVAQEQSMRAENQLVIARQDARRHRREAQMAMGLVGLVLLMCVIAVGWCAQTITAAHGQQQMAAYRAAQATADAEAARVELTTVRQSLTEEREHRAKSEQIAATARGELNAYKGELAGYNTALTDVTASTHSRPTTRPANLIQRFAQAFLGD